MYSIDLTKISLSEFKEILLSIDLLPSRKILLDNLDAVIKRIENKGVKNLAELHQLLKNKDISSLSSELLVTKGYLTVLKREVNSYKSKPVPLEKLEIFLPEELGELELYGIKNTKDFYEACCKVSNRKALSEKTGIDENEILEALELTDLIRINGVGPLYAKILRMAGISSIKKYLNTSSDKILKMYADLKNKMSISINLSLKDIEYCRRFCEKLDVDVE
jgi:hypothetical protein